MQNAGQGALLLGLGRKINLLHGNSDILRHSYLVDLFWVRWFTEEVWKWVLLLLLPGGLFPPCISGLRSPEGESLELKRPQHSEWVFRNRTNARSRNDRNHYTWIFVTLSSFRVIFILNAPVAEKPKGNKECLCSSNLKNHEKIMEIERWGQELVEKGAWWWKECPLLSMFRAHVGLKTMDSEEQQTLRWWDFPPPSSQQLLGGGGVEKEENGDSLLSYIWPMPEQDTLP